MVQSGDFVVFRINQEHYNDILEGMSVNLENVNRVNADFIEFSKGNFYRIQSAVEVLGNQAKEEIEAVKDLIEFDNNNYNELLI